MTIRITTPTTSTGGGTTNAQFTYINHGTDYSPGWRRDYNSRNKPTASEIGALPSGGTAVSSVNLASKGRVSPEGEFQKWNGTAWVKDTEAEKLFRIREAEEKKTRLIQEATDNITILQDAVNFEMATDEEVSMLSSWKKYRVLVSRIDINTAPDIVWPEL
ncbi:tail fiber assembly protein [Escherichia coli]|nr:tail fiber assembly protein [Escherichia coli]